MFLGALMDFFGQGMVIVYPPVIFCWLIVHSNIRGWRRIGRQAYWIVCLAWALMAFPPFYYRGALFSVRWPVPWWMQTIGVIAIVLAVWFVWQAYQVIPRRALFGLSELEPQKNTQPLLETGIYGRTRNPVYLVHALLVVASVCFTGYAANWALLAFDGLFLPRMIRSEERELRSRFGSGYTDYMVRVPRFFPRSLW